VKGSVLTLENNRERKIDVVPTTTHGSGTVQLGSNGMVQNGAWRASCSCVLCFQPCRFIPAFCVYLSAFKGQSL
jgi:hypothetical protein